LHRLGNATWFIAIERLWLSGVDVAEVATTSTTLATNQEGRFAIFPALKDIWTGCFLADGVQTFTNNKGAKLGVLRAHFGARLNPFRLLLDWNRGVTRFDAK
jgi:hypothetical protein